MRAGTASSALKTEKRESVYSDSDAKEIAFPTFPESTKAGGNDAIKDAGADEAPQHYWFPRRVGR